MEANKNPNRNEENLNTALEKKMTTENFIHFKDFTNMALEVMNNAPSPDKGEPNFEENTKKVTWVGKIISFPS